MEVVRDVLNPTGRSGCMAPAEFEPIQDRFALHSASVLPLLLHVWDGVLRIGSWPRNGS